MKKLLLLTTLLGLLVVSGFSQTANYWSASNASRSSIVADRATTRQSFPKEIKLFTLNAASLRQVLFATINTSQSLRRSTVISLPNAAGGIEEFEMFEASNFEPALQARFPEIRSFSGKGITDKAAILKLSISPQGIQTMVFRTGKNDEFIEPYSQDHTVYAVFASQRVIGSQPWTCSTPDEQMTTNLNQRIGSSGIAARSGGDLKTMRLAQSVTAEYSNYFGATSASQVGLVLAAINNTLARCNGVYEKDLALHLNLVAASTNVIYYNPSTDPYSPAAQKSNWNTQLQNTLTANIGEANYDIGHLFGATGGGGNAGCIGCICVDGSKGRGITSPADAIPQGDNFDIDYVVHEIGHQLGANHTFSMSTEGSGVNKEVGSGITIMGYAGITSQDVAPHSIDIFHQASIAQIQANLANKTCPVTTVISSTNATPVVAAVSNYTIPRSTPFALTGAATDANASDVLTYCWEQNDNATSAQTGASSVASPTKLTGPNWLSFRPTTSPTRYCPQLATILAGAQVTGPLPGGDAGANIEALSSVARTLNFRLTVRDNAPYRSTAPASIGQTAFTDMVVTVSALSGPFVVTAPNTAVTWVGGSSQTITWDVAGTTGAPVSCANVKISLSTDGGQTFPTVLNAGTPNDGTEVLTIPNTPSTTARIKVEAVGNIFFDISNINFIIAQPAVLVAGSTTITAQSCLPGNGVIDPGETVTVNFCIQNNGGTATTTNLTGTLQNTGGVSNASAAQNYGAVPTGGSPVCRSFSFTADGTCGGTVTASINFQDGATNLGTITYTFTLGIITPNPAVVTTNSTAISISTGVASPALPYPSNITMSGITNPVSKITVQLNNVNHTYPRSLDILLVSPTGQKVILTSFAGGDLDVVNANLIFDDAANSSISNVGQIPSNTTTTYKPSDYGTASLPAPAPARPYVTALSSLNGLNPNGTWSLYVADAEDNNGGSITGGWTLNIMTSTATCCTAAPVVTTPTATQPTCTTPTGTIVVNATGNGTLEYSVNNGTSWQLSNTFSGLAPGNYMVSVRQQANPASNTTYSGNPVTINAAPAGPASPTVSVTQPTCSVATGTIAVNTPTGTDITYSINGTNYQAGTTFSNVAPGNYSVTARNSSGCISAASSVIINAQSADTQPPSIPVSVTAFLNANGSKSLQPSDVAPFITDNCAVNPNSITVSANNFNCSSTTAAVPHQAYISNTATGNQSYLGEIGMDFTVNASGGIRIDQLGAFDHQSNGITGTQSGGVRVAIFNKATQAIVPGLDVIISGSADPLLSNHRMKSIPVVTLMPGNYVMVAKGYNAAEMNGNAGISGGPFAAGDNGSGAITYTNRISYGADNSSTSFSYPPNATTASTNEYHAGTFNYTLTATNTVTISASDMAGNPSTVVATVNVVDTFYTLTTKNATVYLDGSGSATIQPSDVLLSLKNNCGVDVTTSNLQVSPSTFDCSNISSTPPAPHQAYVSSTSIGNQAYLGEMGMDFTVNTAAGIQINQLGAFDHQADGITGTQSGGVRVAIFNKATQAIVPGLDVIISGSADPLVSNHRMKSITAVTLMPGNYVIVAKGYNAAELNGNAGINGGPFAAGDNGSGAITYTNRISWGADNSSVSFGYPPNATTASTNEYHAGTFNYTLTASTPGSGTTVTLKATDAYGTVNSMTATVTVLDNTAPVLPTSLTVALDASGHASITAANVAPLITDNCAVNPNSITVSPNSFDCSNLNGNTPAPHQAYVSNTATGNQAYLGEIGMDFTVNTAAGIQINQLGAFDHQANGITGTQSGGIRVAIFNKATQAIVSGLDVIISGSADPLVSNHRMRSIPAVTLMPGNYVIVAKGYNAGELNGNAGISGGPFANGDNGGGAITYTNRISWGANTSSTSFGYPPDSQAGSTNEYHAGTFNYLLSTTNTVTISASDISGNVSQVTANVTVTDPNHSCPSAPVIAGRISTAKQSEELMVMPKLSVYPNPSSGAFNVVLSDFSGAKMSIEITDGNGKVVAVKALTPSSKTPVLTVPFDLGSKAPGMYWIKMVSATGVQTAKLMIQH